MIKYGIYYIYRFQVKETVLLRLKKASTRHTYTAFYRQSRTDYLNLDLYYHLQSEVLDQHFDAQLKKV